MLKRVIITVMILVASPLSEAAFFGKRLCETDGYQCKRIKSGQSWRSLWPDDHDRDIVMRVNRMNTALYAGLTIAVPDDVSHRDVMDFAPFPKRIAAPDEKIVVVDTTVIAWAAYAADGTLLKWGPISAGSDYCKDIDEPCYTHAGSYRVYSQGSSDCFSRKFPLPDGGAPMPYCMYFNNGQALHGEPNGLPGYNASHGCVRMYVNDAEWLRYDFIDSPNPNNDYRGTKVIIGPDNPDDNGDDDSDGSNTDSSTTDSQDEGEAY